MRAKVRGNLMSQAFDFEGMLIDLEVQAVDFIAKRESSLLMDFVVSIAIFIFSAHYCRRIILYNG
jgi:hypothetical protein